MCVDQSVTSTCFQQPGTPSNLITSSKNIQLSPQFEIGSLRPNTEEMMYSCLYIKAFSAPTLSF